MAGVMAAARRSRFNCTTCGSFVPEARELFEHGNGHHTNVSETGGESGNPTSGATEEASHAASQPMVICEGCKQLDQLRLLLPQVSPSSRVRHFVCEMLSVLVQMIQVALNARGHVSHLVGDARLPSFGDADIYTRVVSLVVVMSPLRGTRS